MLRAHGRGASAAVAGRFVVTGVAVAILCLFATRGEAQPWDPSGAAVPWTGAPAPIEGRTSGGALSMHGSHVAVAAVLDPIAGVADGALATVALHDGRATRSGRLTLASVVLVDGAGVALSPGGATAHFEPWGWEVTSDAADLHARVRVFFVAEDAVLVSAHLDNQGAAARTVGIVLHLDGATADDDGGDALVALDAGEATLALGGVGTVTIDQAGPPARLGLTPLELGPGDAGDQTFMLGFGADAGAARGARDRGLAAFAGRDAEVAWNEEADLFSTTNAAAACSVLEGEAAESAHRLAVAAIANSLYAPRAALTRPLLSAAKSRDNGFYGSDLPAQAVALAAWDPDDALQAFLGQIDALADDSHVPFRFDDELVRAPLPNGSMPPVQAQALAALARRGAVLSDDELTRVVRRLGAVAAWWPTNRDFRRAGLLVHGSPEEAGRPGSARWPSVAGESEARYFEAPDLSATYVEFLETLADLEQGVPDGDPTTLRLRAAEVRRAIEQDLWDDDRGIWLDRDTREGELSAVIGAHSLAPLAAGMTDDPDEISLAIEETLLEPDRLWGDDDGPRLPIPSISHDAPVDLDASRRQTWIEDVALALRALSRYGRADEATRLEERLLELVARHPEGIYDRYYPGATPDDAPAILQPGAAAAALLGVLHRDHERERTVFNAETTIAGQIAVAHFLTDGGRLFDIGSRARLPHVVLAAVDPETRLIDRGVWRLQLVASCDVPDGEVIDVSLPALGPFRWRDEASAESGRSNGIVAAEVGHTYVLEPLALTGGGCTCRVAASSAGGDSTHGATAAWLGAALLGVTVARAGRRRRPSAR